MMTLGLKARIEECDRPKADRICLISPTFKAVFGLFGSMIQPNRISGDFFIWHPPPQLEAFTALVANLRADSPID